MRHRLTSEFFYQLFALIFSLIVIHAFYVGVVRPSAQSTLEQQLIRQANGEQFVPQRSIYVVMRDYEQESCFVLMFWAMAIMAYKTRQTLKEYTLLHQPLIQVGEGTSILPEDCREFSRPLEALPQSQRGLLLPRTLLSALQRFSCTGNIQDTSTTVREHCETEADRLDSELAMVRYICWAIPSIGFIGTVRGIGDALGQAYRAVEGDIGGVTVSLGVAFNSTFVALVISIVIMFMVHQLQLLQERLVLDSQQYCDANLMRHLAVR
ncbi:MAG: MotA/TolQ/ExbB proton channel family protein [Spongiibacteraceae bacterium]|nr:MotA/TolQ/ExbB proton channel family protein [Spongiibacteraceae bacterium]